MNLLFMRLYLKVSGLSSYWNKQQQTLMKKQHKGLWRQNSLYWLTKLRYNCIWWLRDILFAVLAPGGQSGNFWVHPRI